MFFYLPLWLKLRKRAVFFNVEKPSRSNTSNFHWSYEKNSYPIPYCLFHRDSHFTKDFIISMATKESPKSRNWLYCNRILFGAVVIPLIFPKIPQSSQTESSGFPRVPPPPLEQPGTLKNPIILYCFFFFQFQYRWWSRTSCNNSFHFAA